MKYRCQHVDEFFSLSSWDEDVKGAFGLALPSADWAAFRARIDELHSQCSAGESIKVVYAARHGQAEHNVLSALYGEAEETVQITRPILDPPLTTKGRQQALTLATALQREVSRGMPTPTHWFVSPLRRAGETLELEWRWLSSANESRTGMPGVVIENLREHLHVHQCDARLPLSDLKRLFPSFTYAPAMTEDDTLWQPQSARGRETEAELLQRMGEAMDDVFSQCGGATYISVTSHSGALRGVYQQLGVPARELDVGEMNVLVIRVSRPSG